MAPALVAQKAAGTPSWTGTFTTKLLLPLQTNKLNHHITNTHTHTLTHTHLNSLDYHYFEKLTKEKKLTRFGKLQNFSMIDLFTACSMNLQEGAREKVVCQESTKQKILFALKCGAKICVNMYSINSKIIKEIKKKKPIYKKKQWI